LLVNEQYDDAIALLNKVIWSKGDLKKQTWLLGQTFLIKGDQKQADKYFLSYWKLIRQIYRLNVTFMKGYEKQKIVKSGKNMVEKALSVKTWGYCFLEKLANINLAEQDWDGAKATYRKLQSRLIARNDVQAICWHKFFRDKKYAKAVEIYKELLTNFRIVML